MPLATFLSLAFVTTLGVAPVPKTDVAQAQLRAINHRYVNAFAVGDSNFMDALMADDFLLLSATGAYVDRKQHLHQMLRASAPYGVSYDDVRVRLFGDVALVQGYFEGATRADELARVRYTDAYHWDGVHWRLIYAQNTALRTHVEQAQREGHEFAIDTWAGERLRGDDDVVLRELNENYVRAFRESDVAWYDAHLAPEYSVVYGDGSFHDRAAALADFAKPNFKTHYRSFPVAGIRIRRFDDVALIHAENAFERKDGRRGISRYTDVWHKYPDGRWLCVAAHITNVAEADQRPEP